MRKNVFVYAILIICTVLLISCNTNDNAIQLSDNDQIVIREYLDNDTGRSLTSFKMPGDGDSYSKDIKEMFPKSVQNQIFCDIDEYNQMIEDLQNQINELKAAN